MNPPGSPAGSSGPQGGVFPLLPLRDVVVFPGSQVSLIVGRPRSVAAVLAARGDHGRVFVVMQRASDVEAPGPADIAGTGTIAKIEQLTQLPDGNLRVSLFGEARAKVSRWLPHPASPRVEADPWLDQEIESCGEAAREVLGLLGRLADVDREGATVVPGPDASAVAIADAACAALRLKPTEKQELLETVHLPSRLRRLKERLAGELEAVEVERKVRSRARKRDENGPDGGRPGGGPGENAREDLDELQRLLASRPFPEPVAARAQKEIRRLAQMNAMSAEASVVRSYLDWLLALPWTERAAPAPGEGGVSGTERLAEAAVELTRDHHGLDRVKDRILEFLAVEELALANGHNGRRRSTILCLVGPPGVGKTSFARAIARATGRPFVRIALGGVRDEAEIRGHRRTYIGSMPGRIVQAMKRAGVVDPVILLDEVDKMGNDWRGDPSSALLEVLDPEQNATFSDHYLEIDYDLSGVVFVCTANDARQIPPPLLDRLELVELGGYTEAEKVEIASRHLLPRQRSDAGLAADDLVVENEALVEVVRRWTRESGVRSLERELGRLARKAARKLVEGVSGPIEITAPDLATWLGPPSHRFGTREQHDRVGLVKGMSVSGSGGELLDIEVAVIPGKGAIQLTGKLGDVLKESAAAAVTWVRGRAARLGIDPDFHTSKDLHVHYPGMASGVEGPSAGIAMTTAIVSALTDRPVRADVAMTGEISLRGRVLPIGGVREKLLAAHRGGIRRILLPADNAPQLEEVPGIVRDELEIHLVDDMDDVLSLALGPAPAGA